MLLAHPPFVHSSVISTNELNYEWVRNETFKSLNGNLVINGIKDALAKN